MRVRRGTCNPNVTGGPYGASRLYRSPVSTKDRISSGDRAAVSERLPSVNSVPLKSRFPMPRDGKLAKVTSMASSSTAIIKPLSVSGMPPFVRTVTFNTVLDFFQLPNMRNASLEEAMFLHILYGSLATQAEMLAAILPWSVQRPLRELFAAMNEPGKNYSERNAKRKRLSGSQGASRKRSSTA